MARGRKKIPKEKHELQGTARPARINDKAPRPDSLLVAEPIIPLDGPALAEWNRAAAALAALGILADADLACLSAYCIAWGELVQATEELKPRMEEIEEEKDGKIEKRMVKAGGRTIIIRDKDGVVKAMINHPAVARQNAAMRNMRSFASEFGLTPASRERLSVETGTKERDPFAEWEAKKGELKARKKTAGKK